MMGEDETPYCIECKLYHDHSAMIRKQREDWAACCRASNRLADLVCLMYHPRDKKVRKTWPTATWAEIIASELGIAVPESD